jgi:hypothetical protein
LALLQSKNEACERNLIPEGWFKQWADATFASDPGGATRDPPVLRVPSGTVLDSQNFWRAGKPYYDPSRITVPVLLIHGEWDHNTPAYMSEALLPLLINARSKRHEVIEEATHMVMLEKNRTQLFEAVQRFLEEEPGPTAGTAAASEEPALPPKPQPESLSGGQPQHASEEQQHAPDEQKTGQAPAPPPAGSGPSIVAAAPPQTSALDPDWLVHRGSGLLQQGDFAAARLFFERAAAQGHAAAMRLLAETFDPIEVQRLRIPGSARDKHRAIEWYRRAAEAGRIERLADGVPSGRTIGEDESGGAAEH